MLTILDVIVVARVGLGTHFPWWLWAWAILNEIGAGDLQWKVRQVCDKLRKR